MAGIEKTQRRARRGRWVTAALVAVVVALLLPSAAGAALLCVEPVVVTGCDLTYQPTQVQIALNEAASTDDVDTVRLGPASYTNGPFTYNNNWGEADVIEGAGRGETVLSAPANPAAQSVLAVYDNPGGMALRDLTIQMADNTATQESDIGLTAVGLDMQRITVNGQSTDNSLGIAMTGGSLSESAVNLPLQSAVGNRGIFMSSPGSMTDSTINASVGITFSTGTLTASRLKIAAGNTGLETDGGTVNIDNSLIDLGNAMNAVGLRAENSNPGTIPKVINARHVTIVGGGAGSRGVRAATGTGVSGSVSQSSTITLADSIIEGPAIALDRKAGNNGGGLAPSTSQITTTYSNYDDSTNSGDDNTDNGAGAISESNNTNFDPMFVTPGSNYHLAPGSPLIDIGDPAPGGPGPDIDLEARVQDGNNDTIARRDIGADEVLDTTAPDVSITDGPDGPTADTTPTFGFEMTPADPGATFECRFDADHFAPCDDITPPIGSHTAPAALEDGPHTFSVRSRDGVGNLGTIADRAFTVDTTAPTAPSITGPTGLTRDSTPTFGFSGESGATFECRIDAGAFAPCAGPSFTPPAPLAEGPHSFAVRQTDAVGHQSPVATRPFTVDTVAPQTIGLKRRNSPFDTTPTFRFRSNEPGSRFQCRLNRGAWRACRSPYTTRRIKAMRKPQPNILRIRAIDPAGNVDRTPLIKRFRVRLRPGG